MRRLFTQRPWLVVSVLAMMGLVTATLVRQAMRSSDPVAGQSSGPAIGGAFELLDRDGKPFTDRNLLGRPFAIYFGYTRCPDVCPATLMQLATWRRALGPEGEKLQIVFVTVDPEIDTPQLAGNYGDLFQASIIGLSGTPAQIEAIAKAYKVVYMKVPQPSGGYNVDHSTSVYLMDRNGRYIDRLTPQDPDEQALGKLRQLLASAG